MKGPAIFLAQFAGTKPPFDKLETMAQWAASLGYVGVQVPTDAKLFDLEQAAKSQAYCDDVAGKLADAEIVISELSTHLQGQLVAVHPAYAPQFAAFAPAHLRDKPQAWQQWATEQLKHAAKASQRLNLKAHATFSGALLWHTMYPWPQRPAGLVEAGFKELARRWRPILDAFDDAGVDVAFEIHPGEDLHDGATFERFLAEVEGHPRASILFDPSHFLLQQLDYAAFIDLYHERIKAFHVKDAEFRPNGRSGVYGGYQGWLDRPGRFRSPGDGQIDFTRIFSKLAQYGYDGWAVLEWECCLKHPEDGAREGAPFIRSHMIRRAPHAFDDFAASSTDPKVHARILGLEE
jgi:sugar phosphate isomerase/epimerase